MAATADAATAGVLTSDKDGKFEIHGLTAGTYVLHEVGAPTGYELENKDQEFTVGPNTYTNDLVTLRMIKSLVCQILVPLKAVSNMQSWHLVLLPLA